MRLALISVPSCFYPARVTNFKFQTCTLEVHVYIIFKTYTTFNDAEQSSRDINLFYAKVYINYTGQAGGLAYFCFGHGESSYS